MKTHYLLNDRGRLCLAPIDAVVIKALPMNETFQAQVLGAGELDYYTLVGLPRVVTVDEGIQALVEHSQRPVTTTSRT